MTEEFKKRGRPKTKDGKRVTFYLSKDSIKKLGKMTELGKNASALIEALINSHYLKTREQKTLGENGKD